MTGFVCAFVVLFGPAGDPGWVTSRAVRKPAPHVCTKMPEVVPVRAICPRGVRHPDTCLRRQADLESAVGKRGGTPVAETGSGQADLLVDMR